MKTLNNTPVKSILSFLLVLVFSVTATAQSLPGGQRGGLRTPADLKTDSNRSSKNISLHEVAVKAKKVKLPTKQAISFRAPAKVRIDGRANEWNNQFLAYNHATDIFYTLSNDDDNLYLLVQAIEPVAINRITGAGLTFTIQRSLKKTDKDGISITYPAYLVPKGTSAITFDFPNPTGLDTTTEDVKNMQSDNNHQLDKMCKLIRVTGVTGIDTLISVFNENGILATGRFDIRAHYTFELRVSLKHLLLSANDETKFAYHIQLNGTNPFGPDVVKYIGPKTIFTINRNPSLPVIPAAKPGARQSMPTDFWAEYTLAKK